MSGITIGNLPEAVAATLQDRAAKAGVPLESYLREILCTASALPPDADGLAQSREPLRQTSRRTVNRSPQLGTIADAEGFLPKPAKSVSVEEMEEAILETAAARHAAISKSD